jgi:hypothetical protein
VLAAVGGVLLTSHLLSCSSVLLIALLLIALQLWCWFEAAQRVEYIRGHRAGAHGYDGALMRDRKSCCTSNSSSKHDCMLGLLDLFNT